MLGGRINWVRLSRQFRHLQQHRQFCNKIPTNLNKEPQISSNNDAVVGRNGVTDIEAYRNIHNLDFMKAAKILFSDSPRKKKFGWVVLNAFSQAFGRTPGGLVVLWLDFHLVQLFFALLPSLAVYLVAQYARYDIKKMEAELEVKKKAEEEKKVKEMAKLAEEKKEQGSDQELVNVVDRLKALEETVNEIVIETKKQPSNEKGRTTDHKQGKEDSKNRSDDTHGVVQKETNPPVTKS